MLRPAVGSILKVCLVLAVRPPSFGRPFYFYVPLMITFPNLKSTLDEYCASVQSYLKSNVQVKTGALRDSITVTATVQGGSYSLSISLNHYWKYLLSPVPFDSIYQTISLPAPALYTRYPQVPSSRYPLLTSGSFFDKWQERLNNAFKIDLNNYLHS